MKKLRLIIALVLAFALFCLGGCEQKKNTPPVDDTFVPDSPEHLKDLLNFADPDCLKLFSLGVNDAAPYNTTFTNQYKLVDDDLCDDGKAVEIFIDSGTSENYLHDLVQIDVSAMGITLGEIGEIRVDYKVIGVDETHNWWPRITINTNETGEYNKNTIGAIPCHVDMDEKYASKVPSESYWIIPATKIEEINCSSLKMTDPLKYIGFQFYVDYGQYATFRIDSIQIFTKAEVAARG